MFERTRTFMTPETSTPDPSWSIAIQARQALLWLGPSLRACVPSEELQPLLVKLLALPWAAVYSDAADVDLEPALSAIGPRPDGLVSRLYAEVPAEQPPANRIPIYLLRGLDGAAAPGDTSNPLRLMGRFEKLRRAPTSAVLVIGIGFTGTDHLVGLEEAAGVSPVFRSVVVASAAPLDLPSITTKAVSITNCVVSVTGLLSALPPPRGASERTSVLIGAPPPTQVDITDCVDPSSPITATFDLITASDVLANRTIQEEQVRAFFADPTGSWDAYRSDVPLPRHREYLTTLLDRTKPFRVEGSAACFTAWIQAEPGSGATTSLRALCFDLAKAGFPTLLARPGVERFDFNQLAVFLTQAADRLVSSRSDAAEVPWIIAFDVEHVQNHWDFLHGLANGLKNLHRAAVVIAVGPLDSDGSGRRAQAHGDNRRLGGPLRNSVSTAEAMALGEHLGRFVPELGARRREDWESFINKTLLPKEASRRSLFWLALRFWLFHFDGGGESFRPWLAKKLRETVAGNSSVFGGLLGAAGLATFRLTLPSLLLGEAARSELWRIARQPHNLLGLCELQVGTAIHVTFAHPTIAEEILRIAAQDAVALASVDKPACLNLFDLELHLLGRVVAHPKAGHCLELIEDIATSALRVDPRAAPRNFEHRDRIVALLEQAPDAVWDNSQVFNHHVAIARRHLAANPPSSDWSPEARREQLELAERHIQDALQNIAPRHERGRESPLNMRVSLALTYDVRARLETVAGDDLAATEFRRRASRQYELAQALDADNPYVLENFARFKLNRAEAEQDGALRTKLIVEAIGLLEVEIDVDVASRRDEPVMQELGRAFEMLEAGRGRAWLEDLSRTGDEAATVALARLVLGPPGDEQSATTLAEARSLLETVPAATATWRSGSLLYRITSLADPFEFGRRLDLLRQLVADGSFPWTMQLRMEYAILLFQVGGPTFRQEGQAEFKKIREQLRERSGSMFVPRELKFLADPSTGFRRALRTSFIVKNTAVPGKTAYGVPDGWGAVQVAFRPSVFPLEAAKIKPGRELDCFIQFTNFGPQAVPVGTRVDEATRND